MALNKDEKALLIWLLWIIGLTALGGGVWYVVSLNRASEPVKAAVHTPPVTQVKPIGPKTVVKKSDNLEALAQTVPSAGGASLATSGVATGGIATGGVVAGVRNLSAFPSITPESQPLAVRPMVTAALQVFPRNALCYRGILPHVGPSLYQDNAYAISFGLDDVNNPEAFPRLEFYFDTSKQPPSVSYLSISQTPVAGFSGKETPLLYSPVVSQKIIAEWVAAVATETCSKP